MKFEIKNKHEKIEPKILKDQHLKIIHKILLEILPSEAGTSGTTLAS